MQISRSPEAVRAGLAIFVVLGLAGIAGSASGGVDARVGGLATAAPAETMFYGKTTQGLAVSIPVRGSRIAADDRAYVLYRVRHSDPLEFHPGQLGATVFRGGHLTFHRVGKLSGGTIEVWFEATLESGGHRLTGTYRERHTGFSAPVSDVRTRFAATAWASPPGYDWAGKTADGRPLLLKVGYRLVPGHSIINGRRPLRPTYTLTLPAASRTLVCRSEDGPSMRVTALLPALKAELSGSDDLANAFASVLRAAGLKPNGGLSSIAPASGTATEGGVSVSAELALKRLAWQGGGLAATGTLAYGGTVATDVGTAACRRTTTTFTVRPS